MALRFSLVVSVFFAGMAPPVPEVMRVFVDVREPVMTGASYMPFMSSGYLCRRITEVYFVILRRVDRAGINFVRLSMSALHR